MREFPWPGDLPRIRAPPRRNGVERSIERGMIITDKWREWNGKTRIHFIARSLLRGIESDFEGSLCFVRERISYCIIVERCMGIQVRGGKKERERDHNR